MVQGISSSTGYQYQPPAISTTKLTDDQKTQVSEIIAKYDPSNMSEDDKKTMFEEIKSSGVEMCEDLKNILDEAGFKPPEKPQGPPPSESSSGNMIQSSEVLSFLKQFQSGEISEEELSAIICNLQNTGQLNSGSVIDKKV